MLGLLATGLTGALSACSHAPALAFTPSRASDSKTVSARDYRGKITLLYFGYTFCPDFCPATLTKIAASLRRLGAKARQVKVLFVTVDPKRDSLPVLADYVKNFAPEIDGLRGTPDELASLARRYRVVYSVSPGDQNHPYTVTHSSAIYVFDEQGAARLFLPSLASVRPTSAVRRRILPG